MNACPFRSLLDVTTPCFTFFIDTMKAVNEACKFITCSFLLNSGKLYMTRSVKFLMVICSFYLTIFVESHHFYYNHAALHQLQASTIMNIRYLGDRYLLCSLVVFVKPALARCHVFWQRLPVTYSDQIY